MMCPQAAITKAMPLEQIVILPMENIWPLILEEEIIACISSLSKKDNDIGNNYTDKNGNSQNGFKYENSGSTANVLMQTFIMWEPAAHIRSVHRAAPPANGLTEAPRLRGMHPTLYGGG